MNVFDFEKRLILYQVVIVVFNGPSCFTCSTVKYKTRKLKIIIKREYEYIMELHFRVFRDF